MLENKEVFLDQLAPKAHAIVTEMRGGRGFISRLAGMGISVGCQLEILQNAARGPLLVRVRDTRIALGRGEASKILVQELERGRPDATE